MGVNDELTSDEHDELRGRLLSGARTIKPVGPHRTAWISSATAVALVVALAGGVFGVTTLLSADEPHPVSTPTPAQTSTPAPTPRSTSTPTTEPTGPVGASRGVMPFAGDCGNVLSEREATYAAGQDMRRSDYPWQTGRLAIAGGIDCLWLSSDEYLGALVNVYAFPDELVPSDVRATTETGCEPTEDGDRIICDASGVRQGVWLLVRTTGWADAVSVAGTRAAFDAVAERLGHFALPQIADPTDLWWDEVDCSELAARLDPTAHGYDDVSVPDHAAETPDASTPHPNQIELPASAASTCDLHFTSRMGPEDASGAAVWVATVPGGAVSFDTVEAAAHGQTVVVEGAVAARFVSGLDRYEGSWNILAVTDGVNLLMLSGSDSADDQLSLLIALAEDVLPLLG